VRIILADHHEQSRLALGTLLDEQPELDLIGEAMDAQGLLLLAEKRPPNLVLIDGELPDISIDELIARLHALVPRPIVIVMSSAVESSRKMLRAGADVFVSKVDEPEWLLERLQKYAKQFSLKEAANQNQQL
jgi:two-component system, NarL family, nitrate/nitrite response regulator NarL